MQTPLVADKRTEYRGRGERSSEVTTRPGPQETAAPLISEGTEWGR